MSFSINVSGDRDTALKQIDNASGSGDLHHFDACKAVIKTAIMGMPPGAQIVASASGHHDYTNRDSPVGNFKVEVTVGTAPTLAGTGPNKAPAPAVKPPAPPAKP